MALRYRSLVQRTSVLLQNRSLGSTRVLARAHGAGGVARQQQPATAVGSSPAEPSLGDESVRPPSTALAGKPLGEVVRGWLVFKLLSFEWFVRHSLTLYGVSKRVLGAGLTRRVLRGTVGGQFLGGFSEEEARKVAEEAASRKICCIWNYSTEQDLNDRGLELNQQEELFDEVGNRYLSSIRMSARHNYMESAVKHAAIKLTAIVDPGILLKLSQMLEAVKMSAEKQVCQVYLEIGILCNYTQSVGQLSRGSDRRTEVAKLMSSFGDFSLLEEASKELEVAQFSSTEREQLGRLLRRLDDIGECAVSEGVRVLVDAEESRLQPAIHHLTVHHMMPQFNLTTPHIYNTIQMYLKSSFESLLSDIAVAKTAGFSYGIKMVRGAYMQYEWGILEETGKEYPVHPSKEATDANYDKGVEYVLGELARGTPEAGVGGFLIGTHNKHSVDRALEKIDELGIPSTTGAVCFGQQLGMADYIAYDLVERGFFLHKVLAYGEEKDVLPFLVRRAQENNKTSETARLERQLYGEELVRRMRQ